MEPYLRKVRYWDTDANGHVFNTRYLVYVDDALTDFLDEAGLAFHEHGDDGFLMVIAHTSIDYRTESVIGETLATTIEVKAIGNTSIIFGFEIRELADDRQVAIGEEVYVTVDLVARKPIRVPDTVRELLL